MFDKLFVVYLLKEYQGTTGAGSGTTDSIVVLDFGSDKSSTAGDFQIVFPTADATNALIRIA